MINFEEFDMDKFKTGKYAIQFRKKEEQQRFIDYTISQMLWLLPFSGVHLDCYIRYAPDRKHCAYGPISSGCYKDYGCELVNLEDLLKTPKMTNFSSKEILMDFIMGE